MDLSFLTSGLQNTALFARNNRDVAHPPGEKALYHLHIKMQTIKIAPTKPIPTRALRFSVQSCAFNNKNLILLEPFEFFALYCCILACFCVALALEIRLNLCDNYGLITAVFSAVILLIVLM
jgi:hypothetical protein